MDIKKANAIVTGGASGLGESVVRAIIREGGRAAILDLNEEKGTTLAAELGEAAIFSKTDVTEDDDVIRAIKAAVSAFGEINTVLNVAGIVTAGKTVGRKGPFKKETFELTLRVNLMGTFNVIRLAAAQMTENEPNTDGERGVIINTASIAAFDGQMGQVAYSASKAGIVGMTLPIARDLASYGIRNVTIAPGIFETPMTALMPDTLRESLLAQSIFPKRFGTPTEFADTALYIIKTGMINGETIRLDGAVRMAPR